MWLRVTMDHKPAMINGDRVLRIAELPGEEGQRGCRLYLSLTEYLVVDQSLREMMISLGFEERQ